MYAAYLTPQGRMISDMRVIETGDRSCCWTSSRRSRDALAERLDKLIFSEDVQVKNVTREIAVIGVHGPLAAARTRGRDGHSRRSACSLWSSTTTSGARFAT